MADARSEILSRIRRALRGVQALPLPPEGPVPEAAPYRADLQKDLVGRFVQEAARLGVRVHRSCEGELVRTVSEILRAEGARQVGVAEGVWRLVGPLCAAGFEVGGVEVAREADAGLTGADWGIAETGSLVLLVGPAQDRLLSLLPPVHIALLPEDRIVADLDALFERLAPCDLPAALTFITGPSRTADIEQTLTPGVHGPGVVHVVLVGPAERRTAFPPDGGLLHEG
ncbi:MAG: LUD domain-containing protein [Armatimonadota bacterium]|nr:LUD domain-containing protein [Armatimonadota bacterium]MDR7445044.1 LUD domain-containing protein [Armatimonadota bacterium]MDR7570130.1 LUD domain-containing protein [Armatimonadota bacterium]MDR7614732.1 LUD domain-containing protein [Armatimonadota bacterium]